MDGKFEIIESFGIDDGQLDDRSPQQCFVLGYELALISSLAETNSGEIDRTVHAENIDRIENALTRRGRKWNWMWPSDDIAESWVYLKILPAA